MLLDAGLNPVKSTVAADRQAPPSQVERAYLQRYLRSLSDFVGPFLRDSELSIFRHLVEENVLLGDKDLELTCLNVVYVARKA